MHESLLMDVLVLFGVVVREQSVHLCHEKGGNDLRLHLHIVRAKKQKKLSLTSPAIGARQYQAKLPSYHSLTLAPNMNPFSGVLLHTRS